MSPTVAYSGYNGPSSSDLNGNIEGSLGGLLNRVSIGGAGPSGTANQWDNISSASTSSRTRPNGTGGGDTTVGGSGFPISSGPSRSTGNGVSSHLFNRHPSSSPASTSSYHHHPHPKSYTPPIQESPRAFPPPLEPRSYTILKEVGDGSFGTVWLADWHSPLQLPPGTQQPGPSSRPEYKGKKLVAVKRMKKAFEGGWDECLKLKELKSLRQIPMHANIIPLYDAFLLPTSKELYFVFECMEGNLYQLAKSRKNRPLASGLIASIFHQILSGLDHIHRNGYFHRDMKPENLLITTTGLADYPNSSLYALPGAPPEKDVVVIVKLADFGLARETSSSPPYTEYVSTRWYRAPEVLLRSRDYSNPVDMWALGTILVEMVTLKPLFPGDSEVDQVFKICEVLGDPSPDYGTDDQLRVRGGGPWPRGVKMAKDVGFAFPKMPPRNLTSIFNTNVVPKQLIDCIADLLRYDPKARLTTRECLDHAYFREVAYRFAPHRPPSITPSSSPLLGGSYPNGLTISASVGSDVQSASPRNVPPSHSHESTVKFKPPFQVNGDGTHQSLPPPPSYRNGGVPVVARHYSEESQISDGMSGYGMQIMPITRADGSNLDSPMMSYPESIGESVDQSNKFPSPASSSMLWNHNGEGSTESNWQHQQQQQQQQQQHQQQGLRLQGQDQQVPYLQRPLPAIRRRASFAPSFAPSTLYDGSIFEGLDPGKAASVMSFPVTYNGLNASPESTFSDSPPLQRSGAKFSGDSTVASLRKGASTGLGASPNSVQQTGSPAPSMFNKSRSWGLGSVFSGDKSNLTQASSAASSSSALMSGAGYNPLKRTPSTASVNSAYLTAQTVDPSHTLTLDPKKTKKQLEKEARESERAKREAAVAASRERARAVMKKKSQLMQSSDPLHTVVTPVKGVATADKGKARSLEREGSVRSSIDRHKMPQIVEDTSRLYVSDLRHKARKRDDDDDVHSVSSNETGHSSQRGRPFSISSKATSASDPERRSRYVDEPIVPRAGSMSSATSMPVPHDGYYYTAPNTSHSSLDHQLISNMQGLATSGEPGWRSPIRSESRGHRSSSPRDIVENRYSPYPFYPSRTNPGPQHTSMVGAIDSMSNYGNQAQGQNPHRTGGVVHHQAQAVQSSATSISSIASYRSTPSILPSYVHQNSQRPRDDVPQLPYLPTMDSSAPPSPGLTFPYPPYSQSKSKLDETSL